MLNGFYGTGTKTRNKIRNEVKSVPPILFRVLELIELKCGTVVRILVELCILIEFFDVIFLGFSFVFAYGKSCGIGRRIQSHLLHSFSM